MRILWPHLRLGNRHVSILPDRRPSVGRGVPLPEIGDYSSSVKGIRSLACGSVWAGRRRPATFAVVESQRSELHAESGDSRILLKGATRDRRGWISIKI